MKNSLAAFAVSLFSMPVLAQSADFSPGPVFDDYGAVADIDADYEIPEGMTFKVSYDIREGGEAGARNRRLETAARFLNMHARAGVAERDMSLALVIHGKAVHDVAKDAHYGAAVGGHNANAPMLAALMEKGVRVIVCGQSAAYYDVSNEDLLPGVEMALSAMTAHAVLQQEGYTLNPF